MTNKKVLLSLREFIFQWKEWGFKVAFGNWLICFTKWFVGAKRITLNYPKDKEPRGEYRNAVLFMDLPEGGNFKEMRFVHFSPKAIEGDIQRVKSRPVRFYFELVGFEDVNAPMRDWGMGFDTFKKRVYSYRDIPEKYWSR